MTNTAKTKPNPNPTDRTKPNSKEEEQRSGPGAWKRGQKVPGRLGSDLQSRTQINPQHSWDSVFSFLLPWSVCFLSQGVCWQRQRTSPCTTEHNKTSSGFCPRGRLNRLQAAATTAQSPHLKGQGFRSVVKLLATVKGTQPNLKDKTGCDPAAPLPKAEAGAQDLSTAPWLLCPAPPGCRRHQLEEFQLPLGTAWGLHQIKSTADSESGENTGTGCPQDVAEAPSLEAFEGKLAGALRSLLRLELSLLAAGRGVDKMPFEGPFQPAAICESLTS